MFDNHIKEILEDTNLTRNIPVDPQFIKFTLTFEDIIIEHSYTLN